MEKRLATDKMIEVRILMRSQAANFELRKKNRIFYQGLIVERLQCGLVTPEVGVRFPVGPLDESRRK